MLELHYKPLYLYFKNMLSSLNGNKSVCSSRGYFIKLLAESGAQMSSLEQSHLGLHFLLRPFCPNIQASMVQWLRALTRKHCISHGCGLCLAWGTCEMPTSGGFSLGTPVFAHL